MTDYDIDIREIEPTYKHTLARQAGREVEDGLETHLSRVQVTVALKRGSGKDYDGQTFAVTYTVDHEAEVIRHRKVADAHGERKAFGVEKLLTALEYGHRAMVAFVEDVGPDYSVAAPEEVAGRVCEDAGTIDAQVHTDLEVADA